MRLSPIHTRPLTVLPSINIIKSTKAESVGNFLPCLFSVNFGVQAISALGAGWGG